MKDNSLELVKIQLLEKFNNISKKYQKKFMQERKKIIFESITNDNVDSLFYLDIDEYKKLFSYDILKAIHKLLDNIIEFKYVEIESIDEKTIEDKKIKTFTQKRYSSFYAIGNDLVFVNTKFNSNPIKFEFETEEEKNKYKKKFILNEDNLALNKYYYISEYIEEFLYNDEIQEFEIKKVELVDFLNSYLGIYNDERLIDTINDYYNSLNKIKKMSLEDLFEIDSNSVIQSLIERVYKDYNYNIKEKNKIVKFINESNNMKKICRMLFSYNFTINKLKEVEAIDSFFDLSFVAVSLYKTIEVIFQELLFQKWPRRVFYKYDENKKENKYIYLDNSKITLGNMGKIFEAEDTEIVQFLSCYKEESTRIKILFDKWVSKSRNGYLHKHVIEDNEKLRESIVDSLDIIAMIILLFNDSNIESTTLKC